MSFSLDALSTLLLALLCLFLGNYLKNKIYFFQRFCIPSPVIGGFLISILIFLAKQFIQLQINFDTSLQMPLMVAFFTTVGLGGSYQLLRTGGKSLIVYLLICWFVALYQNALGAFLATLFNIHPVLGVMAGSVSLEGGHGAAAAFGNMAENLGVSSALAAGMASATYGLIAGSLLGGPVANFLILRHKVKLNAEEIVLAKNKSVNHHTEIDYKNFSKSLTLIVFIMTLGLYLAKQFTQQTGFSLPSYVGAMIIAIIIRNVNDHTHLFKFEQKSIDLISNVSLGIFLTMAMMSLRLWDLAHIALPLIAILFIQTLVLIVLCLFFFFRFLGKNYDAAVMCAGLMGHGLGATPNGIANMSSVCEKYGVHSPKAFLIIPICGAVLIDIVAIPWHTWIINYLIH